MSKEIQQILQKINSLESEERAVLATVVDVKGSSYRLPGAKMLILESGACTGTVSGGCLEADILERAKRVLRTDKAQVFTYDTTAAREDSVFSLNMGCRGVIRILLERVNRESFLFKTFRTVFERQERRTVATLISPENDSQIGGRIFYGSAEKPHSENLPPGLEFSGRLLDACINFFKENSPSQTKNFQIGEATFEFFFENLAPPVNLVIFGAGADAVPLAEQAKNLGWRVSVIDHRPAFANRERFPTADDILLLRPEDLPTVDIVNENAVAVVMTHNYNHDREILRFLLPLSSSYVGALGPRRRTESLLGELRERGDDFTSEQLGKLYAPIGLDIGADTPETIALSVVAEIQSVLSNRQGGFLRLRQGGIYNRQRE